MKLYKNVTILVLVCCLIIGLSTTASMLIAWSTHQHARTATGHATFKEGEVQVIIATTLSIVVDDALINFSGCKRNNLIFSDVYDGNDQFACRGFVPDHFSIRNDGDVYANVTMNVSEWGGAHGGTFLSDPSNSSFVLYKISNSSTKPELAGGCAIGLQDSWMNVTSGDLHPVCELLKTDAVENSVLFDIGFFIPANVSAGSNEILITFFASQSY